MNLKDYLPVHCCCDPSIRLGWVPHIEGRASWRVIIQQPSRPLFGDGEERGPVWLIIEAHQLTRGTETIWAVKSNDQPLDVWRKVPGWIEDPRARSLLATKPEAAHSSAGASLSGSDRSSDAEG